MAEDRLSRMEDKIDKLAEAVVSLARMEERMVTLFKRMDKYEATHMSLDLRVKDVEKVTVQRGVVGHILEKSFWLVAGAGVASVVSVIAKQGIAG